MSGVQRTAVAVVAVVAALTGCTGTRSSSSSAARASSGEVPGCLLPPPVDVIVRVRSPGLPETARFLRSSDLLRCGPTSQSLQDLALTGAGHCVWAARVSDNAGYDLTTRPAAPLNVVIAAYGAAC
jgi:hypothetical protein